MNEESVAMPAFRSLLSCFATGVTVATTVDDNGRAIGMTASAVSAVSLDPPLLLVCVNKVASFHDALTGNTGFALNMSLPKTKSTTPSLFAQGLDDPFEGVTSVEGPNGLRLLDDVVAHIICGSLVYIRCRRSHGVFWRSPWWRSFRPATTGPLS